MKLIQTDIAVIGGGPAGLAAALEARKAGARVLLLERDSGLGGILQQCIHDGFGLLKFQQRMSGCQYAQKYIDELKGADIEVKLNTMVLELTRDKEIYAVSKEDGMLKIQAKAVVLAMGCRERTRAQVFIKGSRPAGVFTAGTVQRYINMEGMHPGKKAVILGSGDIGLIMARRMTLEGIQVEGVYEVMASPGGLTRNIVQCLHDYDIPLHLSTTVVKVHGKKRVEGVTVAQVGGDLRPVPGTERYIECDMLVLSVGLIPENELSRRVELELHPVTKGLVVDENMMTSAPGIFAAGNAVAVFDLVDYVSETGETAGLGAFKYITGKLDLSEPYAEVVAGNEISFVLPQRIRLKNAEETFPLFMRVRRSMENLSLEINSDGRRVKANRLAFAKPPEMLVTRVARSGLGPCAKLNVGVAAGGSEQ